jgi:hypothetical protein
MNNNVYIKSKGFTETQVNNNIRGTDWNANYDGRTANLSMNIHNNNSNEHVEMKMDNKQLAELFNFPVIQGPIDQRLQQIYLPKQKTKLEPKSKLKQNILIPIPYVMPPPSISNSDSLIFSPESQNSITSIPQLVDEQKYEGEDSDSEEEEVFTLPSQNKESIYVSSPHTTSIPGSRNYLTSPALNENYYPVTQTHYRSSIPLEKTTFGGTKKRIQKKKTQKRKPKQKKRKTRISNFLRRLLK